MKKIVKYFIIGIKFLLTNTIFQIIVSSLALVLVSVVVYKAVNLRNKVDKVEHDMIEKMENIVVIDSPSTNNKEYTGAAALSNCLKKSLSENDMTEELKNMSSSLEKLFNSSNYNFAFEYKDIYTGFTMSYNKDQPIFGASTVKAPEAIYIYEKAENDEINLDDTITYTSKYYSGGTGILKNTKFNVNYPIHDLVGYSIIYSDNAAHLMLNEKYKSKNIHDFWKEKGTTAIYNSNSPWGNITANDATIYMEELYNYYTNDNKYSNELIDYFYKSWKLISTPEDNIKIASKSGWSESSLHDAAIVFDENPYILIILSNRGYTEYQSFFNEVSKQIYNFHKEYWNVKMNICNN